MDEANAIFDNDGTEKYRQYQAARVDTPFDRGAAFPFIRRLLRLNELYPEQQPVEVVVLSRNDPESGRRFFRSCVHHKLDITRGAFLSGELPYPYIPAFNASVFLSANEADVLGAIKMGLPAGLVLPSKAKDDESDHGLRIAFDFDGVLVNDEAEKVYQKNKNLDLFQQYETEHADQPHDPGPLNDLFRKIGFFQKLEAKRALEERGYKPAVRVAIVTARNAPSNERFVTTLKSWGMSATEAFFMGGIEKKRVLEAFKPHIFFDDQLGHLQPAAETIPSVFIPFGIANNHLLKNLPPDGQLITGVES